MHPSSRQSQEPGSSNQQPLAEQQQQQTLTTDADARSPASSPTYQSSVPYSGYYQQPPPAQFAYRSLDAFAERESTIRDRSRISKKQKLEKEMKQQGYHSERGVSNTLFLSIRSGIPAEIDSALPVILDYSKRDGTPSDFSVYPGSIEALLGLADTWFEDWEEYTKRLAQGMEGDWLQSQEEADHERWALGAILAIRNACIAHEKVRRLLVGVRGKYSAEDLAKLRNARGINGSSATLPYPPPRILLLIDKILQRQNILDIALRLPELLLYLTDIMILILPCVIDTMKLSRSKSSTVGLPTNGNSKFSTPAVEEDEDADQAANVTLRQTGQLLGNIITESIPALFAKTSDLAMIITSIQLFTMIPANILPIDNIVDRLATFLVLTPSQREQTPWPRDLFLQSLGLLYHITSTPSLASKILKRNDLDGQLRILIGLTRYGVKPIWKQMRAVGPLGRIQEISPIIGVGTMTDVKGSEHAGKWLPPVLPDDDGGDLTGEEVGLGPKIALDPKVRQRIRAMREPDRALAWMKECLVFQPQSYMTQVTFWTSYQDFVAADPKGPAIPPPAVAGEVIKAATAAFSGASAMVMREDRDGRPLPQQKFVINGLRFKRSLGRRRNYMCKWQGCVDNIGPLSNAELLEHVKTCHLSASSHIDGTARAIKCLWANCHCGTATVTHVSTHLPLPIDPTKEPEPRRVVIHPDTRASSVISSFAPFRPVPPLSYIPTITPTGAKPGSSSSDLVHPLAYLGLDFPTDRTGQPMQEGYYACMVLKNLARALRDDIERAENAGVSDAEDEDEVNCTNGDISSGRAVSSRNRKRRKLDRLGAFGLPAPPGLLEGTYIDPALVNGSTDNDTANGSSKETVIVLLTKEERHRARLAFRSIIQEPVLQILEQSNGAIAKRLVECLGF